MAASDILIGALIVIVIYMLFQESIKNYMKHEKAPAAPPVAPAPASSGYRSGAQPPSKSGFTGQKPMREKADPYTEVNNFIDAARGLRTSDLAYGGVPPWEIPGMLDRYHQSGAEIKPEDITAAEQNAWTSSLTSDSIAEYNTEHAFDSSQDATGYHQKSPVAYDDLITESVLDPRSVENHKKWAESMMPWSGTSTSPDTLDEALEATTSFIGLRRPQPIAQYNALQVTERDTYTFLGNHKFNFQG